MIYPIKHLPHVIPIGIQTESGVEAIGFDVKPWLDEFDGLKLSIWPTRPGESAAYPAADVELVGTVLYWRPNGTDTAIEGAGRVEVLGATGDKRKLSGWCDTMVRATSLGATQEPPEGARPWVDEVVAAAEEAKKQADRAERIANDMSGGVVTGAVRYDAEQTLTEEEKARARKNIGADEVSGPGGNNVHVGSDEPPEDAEVWIDPEGEVSGDDLPTASTTTKGAVKTGSGLQMDGDVMSAGYDTKHAGSIVYIGADGKLVPLMLGAGLEIADGVLHITGTVTPPDNPDEPITPPNAVVFVQQADGSILVQGVTFVEQEDGSVLWDGATFTEKSDGSYLVS